MDACIDDIKARIAKHFELSYSFASFHGSSAHCFENIAFCVGNCQDVIDDKEILSFYEFYLRKFQSADDLMSGDFVRSMALNGLLFMSKQLNRCDEAVSGAFYERLSRVYDFVVSGAEIFYSDDERKSIKGIPTVWKAEKVVRYEHTNPYLRLPNAYDLLGYSSMYGIDADADAKIDSIAEYVLSDHYQNEVNAGYGIGINGENGFVKSKYYAVGWDIGVSRVSPRQQLLYMTLLSRVSGARRTKWYMAMKAKYARAVATGDYSIFDEICKTAAKTYWTSGCYMNFGRGRREKMTGVIEIINKLA